MYVLFKGFLSSLLLHRRLTSGFGAYFKHCRECHHNLDRFSPGKYVYWSHPQLTNHRRFTQAKTFRPTDLRDLYLPLPQHSSEVHKRNRTRQPSLRATRFTFGIQSFQLRWLIKRQLGKI